MPRLRLRPVLLGFAAVAVAVASAAPPLLLILELLKRNERSVMFWLFAFSFTGASLMVGLIYIFRVKNSLIEYYYEENEREISWELFQQGCVDKESIYIVARAWSKIELPFQRKLLLVRAGVLPQDALCTEVAALSDDLLRIMASLYKATSVA